MRYPARHHRALEAKVIIRKILLHPATRVIQILLWLSFCVWGFWFIILKGQNLNHYTFMWMTAVGLLNLAVSAAKRTTETD